MPAFLDVRLASVGGGLAASVAINQGTSLADYQSLALTDLISAIQGRHVLIGIHGFNVNRADGIAHLANWAGLLQLPFPSVFVGVLWPGDSVWAHGLDYPEEPRVANHAGELLAPFFNSNFAGAASISFVSHSLGARVVLTVLSRISRTARRVTLMAGAIDDNCLTKEFVAAASTIAEIAVLASRQDEVLSAAFPLGNFFGGILAAGHPWLHAALGHKGPSNPTPGNLLAPFQIPDNWHYGHGSYLQIDASAPAIALPVNVDPNGSPPPAGGVTGWQEAWSAAFVSTRFR